MVKIHAAGDDKPERKEVVEPLVEPTPERRRERREDPVPVPPVPVKEPEKAPA